MPRQITDTRFGTWDFKRQMWSATLESATTVEELMHPDFWCLLSMARKITPGALIFADWEDGAGCVILYVRACSIGGSLNVVPLAGGLFPPAQAAEGEEPEPQQMPGDLDVEDGIAVEWAGTHELWRVRVLADGRILKTGLRERREARRQRTNYLVSTGRAAA